MAERPSTKAWRGSATRCIISEMLRRVCIVMLLVTAGTACKHNERAETTVLRRAAFDFPCQQSELTLAVLHAEGARYMASQIAAYGCEKRAIYVFYPDTNTWVLEGAVVSPAHLEPDEDIELGGDVAEHGPGHHEKETLDEETAVADPKPDVGAVP